MTPDILPLLLFSLYVEVLAFNQLGRHLLLLLLLNLLLLSNQFSMIFPLLLSNPPPIMVNQR